MSVQTISNPQQNDFVQLVKQWQFRHRLQAFLKFFPRALALTLLIAISVAILAHLLPLLTQSQLIILSLFLLVLAVLISLAKVSFPRPTLIQSARYFDYNFSLNERVSTALELLDGQIPSHPAIQPYQINDAIHQARSVDYKSALTLDIRWKEWLAVALLAAVLLILILLPAETMQAAQNASGVGAGAAAAEDVRNIMEDVATDTTLSDTSQEELLKSLDESRQALENKELTAAEAFAIMNDVEQSLRNEAESLNESLQAQQAALNAAAESLNQLNPSLEGQESEIPSLEERLNDLQQRLNEMSPEEQTTTAEALQSAAEELQENQPELAEALQDSAQSMQSGDPLSASEALEDAKDKLEQSAQKQSTQQEAIQNLNQSADVAKQSSEEIAEQNADPNSEQNQSGEPSQPQQQDPSQKGEQPPAAQQPQESQQQSPSGQEANEGEQESDQSGPQQGESGQPQSGEDPSAITSEGQKTDQQTNVSAQGSSGEDQSAGDSGDSSSLTDPFAPNDAATDQNNNPDGTGSSEFQSIYAPQRLGGEGGEELLLDPDASDAPVVEGEFIENETGESLIPYNQVFTQYQNRANRALKNDYIPLGLRDIVRDYFTSIEPK